MPWTYRDRPVEELPEGCAGFVYLIENERTGRKYVGKKLAEFSRSGWRVRKNKNGTKRKVRVRKKVESDWKDYWSSSEELIRDVESLGKDSFRREILWMCRTKAECSYIEAREQFERGVLESDEYYNRQIRVRLHQNQGVISDDNRKHDTFRDEEKA